MKRIRMFLFAVVMLISADIFPQHSIRLEIIQDLSAIDPAAFVFDNSLRAQPRIFAIFISSDKPKVKIRGQVYWQEDTKSPSEELANFLTEPFIPSNLFNDQLGSSDFEIPNFTGDREKVKTLQKRGKLTGVVNLSMTLLDEFDNFLSVDEKEIILFNPTAPTLNLLTDQPNEVQIGNAFINWSRVDGALAYKILLCDIKNNQQLSEAIQSCSNPIVDIEVDNSVTILNLLEQSNMSREVTENQRLVLQISTVYSSGVRKEAGGELYELRVASNPGSTTRLETHPEIQRLVNLLKDRVDQAFLDSLTNGTIELSQIQFEDENGQVLQFSDLTAILNYLEANNSTISDISFSAK